LVSLVFLVSLLEKIETLKQVQGDKERNDTELLQHRVRGDILFYSEIRNGVLVILTFTADRDGLRAGKDIAEGVPPR